MNACDPIEDREVLKNSYDPDNIELEVVQSSGGTGNGLTLKMNTPGVYGYWDNKLGRTFSDEVTFISPFMGNVTFTYYVATPLISGGDPSDREYISKSIDVNVQVVDNEVPEAYYLLVGDELESKSWVFDRGNTNWWYMSSGGNEPPNPMAVWWNASECCAPGDQAGKMVFDLNGAANYTYFTDADNESGTSGTFSFNSDFTKLTIGGGINILGAEGTVGVNDCAKSLGTFGEYQIVELTADRLVLYVPKAGCTSGWTWIFVPEQP
jgi:hypothetical protein